MQCLEAEHDLRAKYDFISNCYVINVQIWLILQVIVSSKRIFFQTLDIQTKYSSDYTLYSPL